MVARQASPDSSYGPRRRIVSKRCPHGSGTKHIYRVCGLDLCLGRLHCDTGVSRPRKSSVPQSRPFKAAESRPRTVPVHGWLALRAASTSSLSSASVQKARPGSLFQSRREGSGAMAHGDEDGLTVPRRSPPSARVPGVPQFGYWLQRTGRASSVSQVSSP